LSAPGDLFWMYSVSDPAAFVFMAGSIGELIRYRLMGFSIRSCVFPSYMVSDQKAFTGDGGQHNYTLTFPPGQQPSV
jgi:hypothetical protein